MSIEGLNPLFIIQKYKNKYQFIKNEPVSGEDYKLQPSWYTKTKDKTSAESTNEFTWKVRLPSILH